MDFTCFNCGFLNDFPEFVTSLEDITVCGNCDTNLCLDWYEQCPECKGYYYRYSDCCLNCGWEKEIIPEVGELNYLYVASDEEYSEAILFINSELLLALDTEGNGLDPLTAQLFLIQIGTAEKVCLFDFRYHERLAKEIFWQEPERLFILHNAKFDYKMLKHILGIELLNFYDTYIVDRILTCGIEREGSLKSVVEKNLHIEMDKKVRDIFPTLTYETFHDLVTESLLSYSARDVQLLPYIYEIQVKKLKKEKLTDVAWLEFDVAKVVADIELKGIFVDVSAWKEIISHCEVERNRVREDIINFLIEKQIIHPLTGRQQLNLNSAPQLKQLFRQIGITLQSTSDDELAGIKHPLAENLREYRKFEKQLSSFGESFLRLIKKDSQRIHPSFNQLGADTGRFSCTKPNLQQIPADERYRKCFCAPPGRKIISCDYSQQELRILASLSGDEKFIQFYKDGVDLHSATASMMFNIPIEQVQKETHRKVAKTINFGLAYGQGAKKLGQTIGMSEEEATQMINKYFSQFTFIRDWLESAAKRAQKLGYSLTLIGRKRYYKIPKSNDPEYKKQMSSIGRQGKNTPIQGSGADMIKKALLLIAKRLKSERLDAHLINIVHDEILVEASEQDAEMAAQIVQQAMEEVGKELAPNVPITAEFGIGEYWKH